MSADEQDAPVSEAIPEASEENSSPGKPATRRRTPGCLIALVLLLIVGAQAWLLLGEMGGLVPPDIRARMPEVLQSHMRHQRDTEKVRENVDQISARLQTLESQYDDLITSRLPRLKAEVLRLRRGMPSRGGRGEGEEGERISGLEKSLESRLENLRARLEGLQETKLDHQALETMEDRFETLREDTLERAEKRENAATLLLAVGQLREAAANGTPFADSLNVVRTLAQNRIEKAEVHLEDLTGLAEAGVPPLSELKSRFSTLVDDAAWAANRPDEEGWRGRVLSKILSLVKVRRVDGEGDEKSTETRLVQAEGALEKNRLDKAIDIVAEVPEPAASVLKPWLEDARDRRLLNRRLADLVALALEFTASREQSPAAELEGEDS